VLQRLVTSAVMSRQIAVPLALGEVALVERFEVVGNRSELRLHGGSPGLGGVGGERRLDEYVR